MPGFYSRESLLPQEKWLVSAVALLLGYSAWARGGTVVALQPPMLVLGVLLLLLPMLLPGSVGNGIPPSASAPRRLFTDPLFHVGVAFLALLAIQCANGGRTLVFDPETSKWFYTAPRVPWLPSSISRSESAEMFAWFFPAWAAMLCVRSGRISRSGLRALFFLMVVNAGLLALFGVLQYLSGTHSIFWIQPLDCTFFASFGYENHAGAFFTLMLSLSCVLLVHDLVRKNGCGSARRRSLLIACALLTLLGANLSLSRAAIALSWTIVLWVTAYLVQQMWPRLRPVERLYLVLAIAVVLLVAVLLVAGLGWDVIRQQEWDMKETHRSANPLGGEWALMRSAAVRLWLDHPWFGIGGWGFRYLLGWYIPPELWGKIRVGDASVHNDALQFLSEFGLFGTALLASWAVIPLVSVLRAGGWRNPPVRVALAGLSMTVVQSMIDLPFRCPAVLYAWAVILAALPEWSATSAQPMESHVNRTGDRP